MPKLIHELQSPDVTALKPKVIAAEIEEIARGRRHFQQLLRENRDLLNKPGDYVDFTYRYGTPIFSKVATKLTEVSWYTVGYSSVRITVDKWGGKLQFAREDLEAATRDVLAESLFEAGLDYAEQVDTECKLALMKSVTSTYGSYPAQGSTLVTLPTGTQLLEVIAVTGSTTAWSSADYYTGKVELGATADSGFYATIEFRHSQLPSTQFRNAYSTGNFAFRDLQSLRDAISSQNYHPTTAVLHPESITTLLRDTEAKFLDASAYKAEGLLNGEIGKAGGLRLLDSTRQYPHLGLGIDPDHAGRFVIKKTLESTRRDMPWIYGLEYELWGFFKPGVIKPEAVAVVVNVGGTGASW